MGAGHAKAKENKARNDDGLLQMTEYVASLNKTHEKEYNDVLKAVKEGDESAKTKLAWFMLSGRGGAEVDAGGAVALLEERVKQGDEEAMWMLGVCCEFGKGIEQNIERAELLYRESHGRHNSMKSIGSILLENEHEKGYGYLDMSCL